MDDTVAEWSEEDVEDRPPEMAVYRYDAPFHSEAPAESESEAAEDVDASYSEEEYEADASDDDDEDLFAALDAALDRLEEEERHEQYRPKADQLELTPGYESVYRRHISGFIGSSAVRTAPMDSDSGPGRVRSDLKQLMQRGRLRALHDVERSRVDPWQDILPKGKVRAA